MACDQAGKERKLQLQELEELRLEAYENSQIYKQKVKQFHDRQILRKEFQLIVGKLHSRWDGPFVITNFFSYGVVELKDEVTNSTFQVNGHQLKEFHKVPTSTVGKVESISLEEAVHNYGKEMIAHYKTKSRKTMVNLNLRGHRSFGIVLGIGLT
ncbi:hypothetical protein CR513_09873, partial [Mucuna pruriens]